MGFLDVIIFDTLLPNAYNIPNRIRDWTDCP